MRAGTHLGRAWARTRARVLRGGGLIVALSLAGSLLAPPPAAAASEAGRAEQPTSQQEAPPPANPPASPAPVEGWDTYSYWHTDDGGRRVARIYATPEFRRAGDRWARIDSTIRPGKDARPFVADQALAPIRFGKEADRIVEFAFDKGTVVLASQSLRVRTPGLRNGIVTYEDVARDTDLRYRVWNDALKEELVLRSASSPTSFRFRLEDPKDVLGDLEAQPDRSWRSTKQVAPGVHLVLPAPFAYELDEHAVSPHDVDLTSASMSVERRGDGYDLTVSVNPEWARGKQYPIVLDPTAKFQNPAASTIVTGYTNNGTGGNYSVNDTDVNLFAGSNASNPTRSFLRFDTTRIPYKSKVFEARLGLWDGACMWSCTGQTQVFQVRRLNGAWTSATTWNQLAALTDSAVQASLTDPVNVYDYWHLYDVTAQAQRWIDGTDANHGVVLRSQDESAGRGGAAWFSSRHSDTTKRPYLEVVFTANASRGYPPAAVTPSAKASYWDPSNTGLKIPVGPRRSHLLAGDGSDTLLYYDNFFRTREALSTTPPYTSTGDGGTVTNDDLASTDAAVDGNTMWLVDGGSSIGAGGFSVERYTRSGTTWALQGKTYVGSALAQVKALWRDPRTGRIWVAYTAPDVTLNTHLHTNYSADGGLTFSNEADLGITGTVNVAQFVPTGSSSVGLLFQAGTTLRWTASATSAGTPTTIATVDTSSAAATYWQAVGLDDGRAVLAYSTAASGLVASIFNGSWATPVTLEAGLRPFSLAGDGAGAWLADKGASDVGLRRYNGTSWGTRQVFGTPGGVPSLPARVQPNTVPVWWDAGEYIHFDRLDSTPPSVSIVAPGDSSHLSGTVTLAATASDPGPGANGVSRVDFFVDRGNGWTGFVGSDTTPDASGRFTFDWNTAETDSAWNPYGDGGRLWLEGAYQIYAVAWDTKGLRTESGRVNTSVVVNDLGLHPYRPVESFSLGGGARLSVNMYSASAVLTQPDLNLPTVIGPLAVSRTYNSKDTKDRKIGQGWALSVNVNVDVVFRELIDHSGDALYPSGTVEIVQSDGTQHFYLADGANGFVPFLDDSSRLDRNGNGTWTLTLVDGTRYVFRSDGKPASVTPPQTGAGQSFTYGYDAGGLLTSIAEPTGRSVTIEYLNGKVWRLRDVDTSRVWTYNYTGADLTSVTDPAGRTTGYAYTSGRLAKVTDPLGAETEVAYNLSGQVTQVRRLNRTGTAQTTTFELLGTKLPKVTGWRGNTSACTTSSCKTSYTTTYSLDDNGRMVQVIRSLPTGGTATKTIGWDEPAGLLGAARPRNLKTSETDFLGRKTSYTYDEVGNLVSARDPLGNTTTRRYDEGYSGLVAEYFPNETFTPSSGFPVRRLDATPNFSYGSCTTAGTCSPHSSIPVDNWSARWNGYIDIPVTGEWTFTASADDGKRVWLDGRLILDRWSGLTTDTSPTLTLKAGLHEITAQYRETGGNASFQLSWTGPSTPTALVPAAAFKPGLGLETSRTEPGGNVHTTTYDDPFRRHKLTESQTNTDLNGAATTITTSYSYIDPGTGTLDAYGRVRKKTMPNGQGAASPDAYSRIYDYYAAGLAATNPCTGASVNQGGLLKSETDGTGGTVTTVTHVYDARGNEVAHTDGKGTTCKTYDAANRMTSMKAPDRAVATSYSYNANDELTQVVDPTAGTSTYTYDDIGRLLTAADVHGGTTATYAHDSYTATTQTVTRSDGAGTRSETFDQLGRATTLTFQPSWGGATESYSFTYDANGDLLTRTFPGGVTESRNYDGGGRLASMTQGAGAATDASYNITYDANGRKTAETGPQGRALYTYDRIGRLTRAHDGLGYVRTYGYDRNTNRTQLSTAAGLHYDFDTGPNPSLNPAVTPVTFSDTNNGSTQVSLPFAFPLYGQSLNSLWVSVNGYVTTAQNTAATPPLTSTQGIFAVNRDWALNTGGTVVTAVDNVLTPTVFAVTWNVSLASAGNLANPCCSFTLYLHNDGRVRVSFASAFDTAGAVVGASKGNGLDFVNVGPVEQRGIARAVPGVTTPSVVLVPHAASSSSTTYDAVDRVTPSATRTYDSAGNTTRVGNDTFGFDGRHLLTSTTSSAGSGSYAWDGENRVVAVTSASTTTRLHYSTPGEGGASYEANTAGTVLAAYLVGPGGQLAEYTPSVRTLNLPDPKGSIALRRAPNGDITQSMYDEFGVWRGTIGSSQRPVTGYLGVFQKRNDVATGVVLMGVRGYLPGEGRFLQRDPIDGGSANAYEYCIGDPINCLDLDGRRSVVWNCGWTSCSVYFSVATVRRMASMLRQPATQHAVAAHSAVLCSLFGSIGLGLACGAIYHLGYWRFTMSLLDAERAGGCLRISFGTRMSIGTTHLQSRHCDAR